MAGNIVITAFLDVTEGKMPRLVELLDETIKHVKEHQPYCLEFRALQDGTTANRVVLNERYESREALEKHRADPQYTAVFKTMEEEQILAGPPTMAEGTMVSGFWSR